ncbi:MAG: FAD-dependent oxidoreductase [Anaerolineae bacterium]|nr:FAD-dependent oxidoreductase [Anaerolineae bacterium]
MHVRTNTLPCIVVGAGIAGLLAAQALGARGVPTVVLDKGRGVGGRMATRRMGEAVFDHGAQFFTVRDQRFGNLVDQWQADGVVVAWARGFADAAGGMARCRTPPRYRGIDGMTAIAKHLARKLDVRRNTRVTAIRWQEDGWAAHTESGDTVMGRALVLTPPVPQSLALLAAGGLALPADVRDALSAITYTPCIALLARLEGPSQVPEPGGLSLTANRSRGWPTTRAKGISPHAPAITVHAGPAFSSAHWEAEDAQIARTLLAAAGRWIGHDVCSVHVQRWRYSRPAQTGDAACLVVSRPAPIVFAGDAFGGARVEGAALSGLAAADQVLEMQHG